MYQTVKKFYFNMVEIALAMAIIAIGISSILVLFPVGLNASKSAIADNNLADVAEYLLGYYKHFILNEFRNNRSIYDNLKDEPTSEDMNTQDWTSITNFANLKNATGSLENRVFKFEQTTTPSGSSTPVVDFSAVAKIWVPAFPSPAPAGTTFVLQSRNWNATGAPYSSQYIPATGNYAITVCLELSWPAEVPYQHREKRVFVQELYNPEKTL